jgi:hypothetical protein
MRALVKAGLEKYAPRLRYAIPSFKSRHLWGKRYGDFQAKMGEKFSAKAKPVVLSGPFKGMSYINDIVCGAITPKWLGTYECELHPVLDEVICDHNYDTVIDVGAAEGYYAIGLGRHLPKCVVFTFDLDFRGRFQQRRLASLNNANNIIVGFRCDHAQLERRIGKRCLVICDVEGFEVQLPDPAKVPALSRADVLVEVNPAQNMGTIEVRDLLIQRFRESHEIEVIDAKSRDFASFRHLVPPSVTNADLVMSLDEGRNGPQCWLWMRHIAARF